MSEQHLSIVAVGAHLDDCYLGLGGVALKASRAGHRVTFVQAVSQYGAWPVVSGRGDEIAPLLADLQTRAGVSVVKLGHDYMRLENTAALVDEISHVLHELRPDVVFAQHTTDTNQDHVALGQATRIAAFHGACFVGRGYAGPREVYRYQADTQAYGFQPDTYVDISDELWDVLEIQNAVDDMYARGGMRIGPRVILSGPDLGDRTVTVTPHSLDKYAHSALWGLRSGVRYAEGFAAHPYRKAGKCLIDRLS